MKITNCINMIIAYDIIVFFSSKYIVIPILSDMMVILKELKNAEISKSY